MTVNKKRWLKKEHKALYFGLVMMSIFILWSLFPAVFTLHDPKEMFRPWQKISSLHWLGTNDMGYDIYSELVYAASTTLITGISAAFISLVFGTSIGTLAGYSKGWKSELFNGVINIFLLIPMLPMIIVVAAYLGPGTKNIILTIALLGWCSTARAVRAKTKQLKQSPFVESLIILGIPKRQIIKKHIIPNLSDIVLARYIMSVASYMLMEASVSFVGLGDPTKVTWGGMISFAFKRGGFIRGAANWYLTPGICIMLCVLAFYFINAHFEQRAKEVDGEGQSYMD